MQINSLHKVYNSGIFVKIFQKEMNFDSWSWSILVESSVLGLTQLLSVHKTKCSWNQLDYCQLKIFQELTQLLSVQIKEILLFLRCRFLLFFKSLWKNVFLQKVSKKFFPWHKNVTTHTVYVGAHLGLELPAPRGPWSPSASTHVHQALVPQL